MKECFRNAHGFTLIEVIVTLLVAAILGSMLVTLSGTALERSTEPVVAVNDLHQLTRVMDNITAVYLSNVNRVIASGSGESDILNILDSAILAVDSDPGTGFGAYRATKVWYSGPPFDDSDSESDSTADYLKVTVRPLSGSGDMSLTAIFIR